MPDEGERLAALDRGELDLTFSANVSSIERLATRTPTLVEEEAVLDYIVLNTTKAPLDDVRVRRALSLASNRKALAGTTGLSSPLNGFIPSASPFFVTDSADPGYNPTEAKQLIEQYQAEHDKPRAARDHAEHRP